MARFQQYLEAQVGAVEQTNRPSATNALAGLATQGLNVAANIMSSQNKMELERQEAVAANQRKGEIDNLASRIYDVQLFGASNKVRAEAKLKEIRSQYLSSGGSMSTFNDALARAQAISGQSFVNFAKEEAREAQQEVVSEAAARATAIDENYSLIPDDYKAAFVQTDGSGVVTEQEKIRLFSEYQKDFRAAQAASAEKEEAIQSAVAGEKGAVQQFSNSMNSILDTALTKPMINFFNTVTDIDPNSPEASQSFSNARTSARVAASQTEMLVRAEYAELINNLTDEDQIELAEKRRDSVIDTIENFVTDIESASLDQMARKKGLYNSLITDAKLEAVDAIAQGQVLEAIYGSGTATIYQNAVAKLSQEQFEALVSPVTGTLSTFALKQMVDSNDRRGGYDSESDFVAGYGVSSGGLSTMNGVVDSAFTDRFSKDFIYAADYALDGNLSVDDMKEILSTAGSEDFQWQTSQLTERQQEAVNSRVRGLQVDVLRDRSDGDIPVALSKPYIEWDAVEKRFNYVQQQERSGRAPLYRPTDFPENRERIDRKRKQEVAELNERMGTALSIVREEQPDIEEAALYRYFNLPVQ